MIRTIFKNRKLIWEGFMNKIFPKYYVEKIYKERLQICKICIDFDETGSKCVMPGTQPCCGVCGCSLSMKLRSLGSECPFPQGAKWKAVKDE